MPTPRRVPLNWGKVRVWWSATHRWTGVTHVAAAHSSGYVTRCGLRIYKRSKNFKLYDWAKGNSPIVPTCGQCLKLRKYDVEIGWAEEFPKEEEK